MVCPRVYLSRSGAVCTTTEEYATVRTLRPWSGELC